MEAKELRIGILVYRPYDKTVHEVTGFMDKSVWLGRDGRGTYFSDISKLEGIPLTEEWLINMGFEVKQNGLYKDFIGGCIRLDVGIVSLFIGSDYSLNTAMDYEYAELPNEVEHVHSLQNLYFALTSKELKTNDNLPHNS